MKKKGSKTMRLIRKIISLLLVFILGFWMAWAGILEGTEAGAFLETAVSYLPNRQEMWGFFDKAATTDTPPTETSQEVTVTPPLETARKAETGEVANQLVEEKIISLTNTLRQEKGLEPLVLNEMLRKAAYIRAEELEAAFSHTRPDGSDAFTVFQEEGVVYPYRMVGENLAMGTYYLPEEEMAQFLFDGWVDSEGHYENMIRAEYREIGVGVHFDGEFLYTTQVFGTSR